MSYKPQEHPSIAPYLVVEDADVPQGNPWWIATIVE